MAFRALTIAALHGGYPTPKFALLDFFVAWLGTKRQTLKGRIHKAEFEMTEGLKGRMNKSPDYTKGGLSKVRIIEQLH